MKYKCTNCGYEDESIFDEPDCLRCHTSQKPKNLKEEVWIDYKTKTVHAPSEKAFVRFINSCNKTQKPKDVKE